MARRGAAAAAGATKPGRKRGVKLAPPMRAGVLLKYCPCYPARWSTPLPSLLANVGHGQACERASPRSDKYSMAAREITRVFAIRALSVHKKLLVAK